MTKALLPNDYFPHFTSNNTWDLHPQISQPTMNYQRCADLHNEIFRIGWHGFGRALNDLPQRPFFDVHGEGAGEIRPRLSGDLVRFLERAWQPEEPFFSFFYYVYALRHPSIMFEGHDWENEEEPDRFLTLYMANDLASHQDGIV